MERENVHLMIVVEGAELYPSDNANTGPCSRFAGSLEAVDGIVIGKREGSEAALRCSFDYSLGRERPVRGGRVSMQVDMCRPARLWTHCS
jgi:hypothetical protein